MSFCKVGEKAYLRINGSEVWTFDGPISVEVQREQGKIFYPNVWFWRANFLTRSCINAYWGWERVTLHNRYWHTYNQEEFIPGFIQGKVRDPGGNLLNATPDSFTFDFWNGLPQDGNMGNSPCSGDGSPPVFHSWVLRGARGINGQGGHNEDPIPGQTTYKLSVNGKVVKISSDPIDYSVRCGDRCPPGEKWSEKCNACVCEGMDGILADLRGATAMARQLRNKA